MKKILMLIIALFIVRISFAETFPTYFEMKQMKGWEKAIEYTVKNDPKYYVNIETEKQFVESQILDRIAVLLAYANQEDPEQLEKDIMAGKYDVENKVWFLLKNTEQETISITTNKELEYFILTYWKKKGLKKKTISRAGDVTISEGKRAGVNTASTRASDAKEDLIWDE